MKKKAFRKSKGQRRQAPSLPPKIQITPTLTHVFRYQPISALIAQSCSVSDLILLPGLVCTVNLTQAVSLFTTIKIHSIKVWPGLGSSSAATHISWASAAQGFTRDDSKDETLPGGVTVDECLVSKPPKRTLWTDWLNGAAGAQLVFTITCPAGSVIDFHASWQTTNTFTPLLVAVNAVTLGTVFYPALDGVTTHLAPPVQLPTGH